MKKLKKFLLAFICILSVSLVFSQTPVRIMDGEINYLFNDRLSDVEILELRSGEVVTKSIKKLKYARINEIPETEQLIQAVREVNPNHLAEIIKILPYQGYENLTEIISDMLKNEESYTKVPFSYNDDGSIRYLYSLAEIQTIEQEEDREFITEKFIMPPLDYFIGRIESCKFGNYFFYHMQNTNKIRYKIFSAVGKRKLIAVISLFRYGDNWIIYALGGVDMIRLPFIDSAVDRAFYNRIKTFCLFTFEKLEESRSKGEEK